MAALVVLMTGCGNTDGPAGAGAGSSAAKAGPKVVASTTWVGALAKAAGATDVTVIAPASVAHPPDYEPKPSDLASVASADYVLFAEFDGFAAKIKEAAGGGAQLVPVELENSPKTITAEVTRLGELFQTSSAATSWLSSFDSEYARLSHQVKSALPSPAPTVVSHAFMAYWAAEFAGLPVVGTYGPAPVTPSQLAELSAQQPDLVIGNSHLPDVTPDISGAPKVNLANFPGADLDLLAVFRANAERISAAVSS